jgi:2-C-methyl-D-erythritol 4-phosphate cytidylyltransferase
MGLDQPKALMRVGGEPLLVRTLWRFQSIGLVDRAVIVVPSGHESTFKSVLQSAFPSARFSFPQGGAERQISVANGLTRIDPDTEIVVIHDAARPFVSEESIRASISAAEECGAATVAIPSVDTILRADAEGYLIDTPDRQFLWMCQTPQTFRVSLIRAAHEAARRENYVGTDDASLVRRMGGKVRLVMGSPVNFKVTTPADLVMAEYVIQEGLA